MFEIDGTPIGEKQRPYVIAEVGINARSDLELAKAHIEAAAEAGADAVKFQTHLADSEMARSEMERIGSEDVYRTVAENEWSVGEHKELSSFCQENGVQFLSTPFSAAAVDVLTEVGVPAIKIGSGELTNRELLDKAARTGKPLMVSTGMSNEETVEDAYRFLSERTDDLAFLYCVSSYPTEPEDLHLSYIDELRETYGVPVGFSDHSTGVEASVLSLGHGVSIIEKHFTIDRRLPGPDQPVSVEPEELAELVRFIDYAEEAKGSEKPVTDEEEDVKAWARHSVVAEEQVSEGEEFTTQNLTAKRPNTGISAERYFDIVGATAAKDVSAGEVLSEDDITGQ